MISKAAYVHRISHFLDADGDLDFLHLLSHEELRILWAKVGAKTLRLTREVPPSHVAPPPASRPFPPRLADPRPLWAPAPGIERRRPQGDVLS